MYLKEKKEMVHIKNVNANSKSKSLPWDSTKPPNEELL